ncbi:MAG TPA: hypothetical protein VJ870_04665 [Amycolatopsis sp.]|nr:hypothetical protein [Amycolatopsis sp.]
MTNTRNEDVRKAVNTAVEQLRTPLLAALGAGNLATQAVTDAVAKAKERGEAARKGIEDLPSEVTTLREKLEPAELRKLIDEYTQAALKLYNKLAESGEQTWDKFTAEPRVKSVLDQVEEVLHTAQDRAGEVSHEAREKVEEVLGMVAKRTRAGGEKVAEATTEATTAVAERIEAEDESAAEAASAKPAPKTATATPRATSTPRKASTPAAKKPASGPSTTSKTTK